MTRMPDPNSIGDDTLLRLRVAAALEFPDGSMGASTSPPPESAPRLLFWHGRGFLAKWGEQAQSLGWTSRDLFGLGPIPDRPAPFYRCLSRYDMTGLSWLLRGRPEVALTEATAAVGNPTGAISVYRKNDKPAYGPLGDSLHGFGATCCTSCSGKRS
jgi:hypothetical protein